MPTYIFGASPEDRISTLADEILVHILSFLTTRQAIQTSVLSKRWKHSWTFIPALIPSINQAMSTTGDGDGDWFHCLPHDVLIHILSLVTTRKAIQMSLLSKRWKDLWFSIPSLSFDEREFPRGNFDVNPRFSEFIDEVLYLREGDSIKKFYFSYHWTCGYRFEELLLPSIMRKSIEELVVWVGHRGEQQLLTRKMPPCILFSQSLKVLKLNVENWVLEVPHNLTLSRLTSLHLGSIISEGDSLTKLIAGCPYIEDLYLINCYLRSLSVVGNTLKKLWILQCGIEGESKVQVSLSSLLSFYYWPKGRQDCSLDNLVSLKDARIVMECNSMTTICGILRGICNATFVELNYARNKHLCLEKEHVRLLSVFHNLTCLKLHSWLSKDRIREVINILHYTPELKTLVVTMDGPFNGSSSKELNKVSWAPNEISPPSLLHLKNVQVKDFQSFPLVQWFAKFLLGYTNREEEKNSTKMFS